MEDNYEELEETIDYPTEEKIAELIKNKTDEGYELVDQYKDLETLPRSMNDVAYKYKPVAKIFFRRKFNY